MQALPPELSLEDKTIIFQNLNINLNWLILQAFLHGLYSGIVTVTLWVIYSSPKRLRSRLLCTIIITLYVLSTITFGINWSSEHQGFIDHGDNYYSIFITLVHVGTEDLISSVAGGISTLLVDIAIDLTIIDVAMLDPLGTPMESGFHTNYLCNNYYKRVCVLCLGIYHLMHPLLVMKTMQIFSSIHNSANDISAQFAPNVNWSLINIVLILVTTFWCTFFIVYRVARHTPEMSTSRKIIKMLIESSAMYSTALIIYLALALQNSESGFYIDVISAYIRAIASTLLAGHVSAYANTRSRREKIVAT
ncbi:hypothetical protein IW261DRAFT_1570714 [Armillaria novae-zelandiae]|uniref:Uncharacterized protein n=1 Tax=Armillaria novae-zelandiae TaxID=153914 RepID=A0AA39NVH0_9AGAR|nr:hypothetical protein IW261DRAFT_1570714 [Armillaria novae-zelandiae]